MCLLVQHWHDCYGCNLLLSNGYKAPFNCKPVEIGTKEWNMANLSKHLNEILHEVTNGIFFLNLILGIWFIP